MKPSPRSGFSASSPWATKAGSPYWRTLGQFLLLTAASATFLTASPAVAAGPALDKKAILASNFGNDAGWYADRIPLFESSDAKLDRVYYYRWSIYRAHQRDLGAKGYITTEFMDDVGWQREPYASLNDATGFHLYEGRWLRDRRFVDDYINFLYAEGGNDRHFSEAIADAVWARYLVDRDRDAALRHLPAMRHIYGLWDDKFDFSKGLYWIEPLLDATEYTVSSIDASGGKDGFTGGEAFRPSINAYMAANARAIANLSTLSGDAGTAKDYAARHDRLKERIFADLWNDKLGHFTDRFRVNNDHVRYWDPIRARELVGYVPWTFDLVGSNPRYEAAWSHLLSQQGFAGKKGMRTVEPGYQYYMKQYRYDKETGKRECQWNGPIWPFQTTQVLMGLAHQLRSGSTQSVINRADYMRLLRQYAEMHYQGDRLDLEEDYDPETGKPIVGLARSHHYFHSGFNDLVISGLVGIRPSASDELTVDPLLPVGSTARDRIRYFALQDTPYHGRLVSIIYDEDGRQYGMGKGLRVFIDGKLAGSRERLGALTVAVRPLQNSAIVRPTNQATQLVRNKFPMASASSGNDPEKLHDGIDGRVWFFPELPNGWETTSTETHEWYAVDFGKQVSLTAAEISFFEGGNFAAPRDYSLEYWTGTDWLALPNTGKQIAKANSSATLSWPGITTSRVRVNFTKSSGRQVRLAEIKLY